MKLNVIIMFIIAGLIKYLKKKKNSKSHTKKWEPFGSSYYRIFIVFKFLNIKIQRQDHDSYHKIYLNIVIVPSAFGVVMAAVFLRNALVVETK